jgi:hypothetical protein
MAIDEFEYDVALSFAGEGRAVVEKLAKLLIEKNMKVFYDEYEAADVWGKDLIAHLVNIYSRKARYCVMFISQSYPLKKWTKVERMAAQERAFRDAHEYILPLRLDDTEVPGITETTGYRDLRQHSIESIVDLLEQKLIRAKGRSGTLPQSSDLRSGNVSSAKTRFGTIPMPKRIKTFTQLEKDRFTRDPFSYIKEYFLHGLRELERNDPDIQTDIEEITSLHFMSRIYVRGDLKAECNIWLGDSFGRNSISYHEGSPGSSTNPINESMTVEDNGEELGLHFGIFGFHEQKMATQKQSAEHLWKRFTAHLGF